MASDRKVCRNWQPLIHPQCKYTLNNDHTWIAELLCVTQTEFGGSWSSWSEFTAVFLQWIDRAASLDFPVHLILREKPVYETNP